MPEAAPPEQDPATFYAQEVVAGRILAGSHVRAACRRHLHDLEHGEQRGLIWKPAKANLVYRFFAGLRLGDGEHADSPFYLELPQCFIVGSLFGWYRDDGYRRFRTAYIEMGKGSGKTPLCAGIGLYGMLMDGEPGAEIYSAAVSRDQAGICFRDAKRFAEATPALADRLEIGLHNIADLRTHSFMRPVSSEGRSADGKRVHITLIDELHEHPSSVIVDKMRAGTKGRRNALIIEITNSGHDRNTVCFEHHQYSERVLRAKPGEQYHDDSWFAYVCTLDPCQKHADEGHFQPVEDCDKCDNWMHDSSVWIKANPLLGITIHEQYLAEQVREARGMPSKQNIVARLNFCVWTESSTPWISRERWDACQTRLDMDELEGRTCFVGIDLSGRHDLTAVAFFFPDDVGGGDAFVEFWTPGETLKQREDRDKAPYTQWVREKHLHAVPGKSINYTWVSQRLGEHSRAMDIRAAAYDRWRIDDLRRALDASEVEMELVEFGQGFKDMSPAVDALETNIMNGGIRIHSNPVLTWNAAAAVLEHDAAGNKKFTKRKATGRIDGIVALAMAVGIAAREDQSGGAFSDFIANPIGA